MNDLAVLAVKALMLVLNSVMLSAGGVSVLFGVVLLTSRGEAVSLIAWLDRRLVGDGNARQAEIDAAASFGGLMRPIAIGFCVVGGAAVIIACLGGYGVCWEHYKSLTHFAYLMCTLTFLHAALLVLIHYFRNNFTTKVSDTLLWLQDQYYLPLISYSGSHNFSSDAVQVTHIINRMQIWFECCGAKQVGDVTVRSRSWNGSDHTWGGRRLARSITCCKLFDAREKNAVLNSEFRVHDLKNYLMEPECPFYNATVRQMINDKTCSKVLIEYATKYSNVAMICCCVILGIEILSIVGACYLRKYYDDIDDDTISQDSYW